MTDTAWLEIEENLEQLHKDGTLIRFHPLIAQIKHMASARPYPPDIFRAFIELIRQMGKDVKQGKPVQIVLEEAASRKGDYNQPSWDVDNVYQAHGHIFQFILNKSLEEIQPVPADPKLPIPIVLSVMTVKEAQEMISGTAFQEYPKELREDFNLLQQLLGTHGMTNWVQNYKQVPASWQPFTGSSVSIEQLINQVLLRIEGFQKLIVPDFIDIRTLNEEQNRETLLKLRNKGCVVILDVLSMQHPMIQHQFRCSLLDVFPTCIVARVAPVIDILHFEQRIIAIIEQHIEMEFFKRVHMDWDDKCQEISTPTDFARWLKNQLPKLIPEDIKEQTGLRKHFYSGMNGR